MEPGGRQPAPGALRLVQVFVNTTDLEDGREEFGSPEQLGRWLAAHELLGADAQLGAADLDRAITAREALRALLFANNGGTPDPAAAEVLNRLAARACLRVEFGTAGAARLVPCAPGLDGALGQILASVFSAMAEGTWPRLKACQNDVCRWAFYDASKNHGGAWCSMAICGSRLKARAYRQRQRAAS